MNTEQQPPLAEAVLQRLRFELGMGVEVVRPGPRPANLRAVEAACPPAAQTPAPGTPVTSARAFAPPAPAAARPAPAVPAPTPARAAGATLPAAPAADAPEAVGDRSNLEQEIAALTPEEKAARWAELERRALGCTRCGLHRARNKVVFGDGNREARLVFVGEGPGADEDRLGLPFVGRAGELLNKIIAAMGLRRDEVYICNTVKCRPPGNRTPADEELRLCWPFLEEQLALIRPKVIVTLGSPATHTVLQIKQGIMSIRGNWRLYRGIRVMPTYHPAFVLRQYTPTIRGQVWSDMQLVMKYLKETP